MRGRAMVVMAIREYSVIQENINDCCFMSIKIPYTRLISYINNDV